jgi:hypothetical protein
MEIKIPEDDLQIMAKSWNINYRDLVSPLSLNFLNLKRVLAVIFQGQAISACRKPELIGIFKLILGWGLKNTNKLLQLDKAIPEILKLHLMVLCSSPEIYHFFFFNLPGLQFISVDRMSLVSPPSSHGREIHLWI